MKLYESLIYKNDLDVAIEHSVYLEHLKNSSILVTGSTGTIGSFIVDMLLRFNETANANIRVYVAGRNTEMLLERYRDFVHQNVSILPYDLNEDIGFDMPVDYIIHAAGNAYPAAFVGDPVGTIIGNISGTHRLLEYARMHAAKRVVYVSSGEVYGQGDLNLEEYEESYVGYLDTTASRSCYPLSKRATENLCASYYSQYGLETVIVRPCHTYGPCMTRSDNRANVQFIHNALDGNDIILKSAGAQMRSYNYVADCVSALFTVLINGCAGEAYNLANPEVRITVAQLAHVIADVAGKKVIFEKPDEIDLANRTPIEKQVLSSKKIEALGWSGAYSIETGVKHLFDILSGK